MNDYFLIFNPETGDVTLSDHAKNFTCFSLLKDADTTKSKNLYHNQLKALFYLYSINSPLMARYTPEQRREFVFSQIITLKRDRIESPQFETCERVMLRHGMSREEAQFEQLQTDFDCLLDHLNSIPWEREVVEISDQGKKKTTRSYKISNMDERIKAIKNSKDILQLQKELEGIVATKRRSIEQSANRIRKFEDPESLPINGRASI